MSIRGRLSILATVALVAGACTGGGTAEETVTLPGRPLPKGPAAAAGRVHSVESGEPEDKR